MMAPLAGLTPLMALRVKLTMLNGVCSSKLSHLLVGVTKGRPEGGHDVSTAALLGQDRVTSGNYRYHRLTFITGQKYSWWLTN